MDEYDEMFEIEDNFEDQFADELDALAQLEEEYSKPAKRQRQSANDDASPLEYQQVPDQIITPTAKRQKQDASVVKRLFTSAPSDDITPPSSPEHYGAPPTVGHPRPHLGRGTSSAAAPDISSFATRTESPQPPAAVATQSRVMRRPPLQGDYITVTDSSGSRIYLRQKDTEAQKAADCRMLPNSQGSLGLLAVPISVLREQEADRRHQQVVEESQRLAELLTSSVNDILVEPEGGETEDGDPEDSEGQSFRLWVDRYSPRHYTELLSDDFTNRCLLKWLKLWDTVVFGKERASRPAWPNRQAPTQTSFKSHQANQNPNRFKTKMEMTEEILEAELDPHKRPKFKVALLSGPPGLGKTTLAHVIAKHAGYNVVEINASDDRSAEVFQKRIDTATQMKSVLGADERPNCLVIDEIDGAPAATINVLLATLNRKDGHGSEAGADSTKKKKKKESILMRPIICICNDLYVPALRPLRQQAFLLTFPQTQPTRLAQRLAEISLRQGMKADTGALMLLCEKTDNDIRSCINTLQFLFSRGHKQLNTRTIQCMSVGQKDQNKGLFHLWQEIFQLPRSKRKRIGESFGEVRGSGGGGQRFQHILDLATSSGEYEKVSQGLHDNYLSMRVRDPNLQNVCDALDWICFSDRLNQVIMHGQNFTLMKYLPFLSVAYHFLFAHTHVLRINYPHTQHELTSQLQSSRNALSTMLSDIPARIRTRISQLNLALDILTLLLDIISPKLRPVNPQLFSRREKEQMCELIDTMLAYNLSYRQDRTPEGQYTYILEPRVEEVVRFSGLPPRRQLTYQAKQTISREMEQEKMRRAEQLMLQRNPITKEVEKVCAAPKPIRNHHQRLENIVRQTTVEPRQEVDFFGRAVAPKQTTAPSSSDAVQKCAVLAMGKAVGNSDVWFRFNEGMSNAVRRNVYIRELL